ncbi:MAG TPA: hypothetical protein VG457_13210 [Planctomycetota bacterium]|jgi:hypothetical protein|nr:hypothetical protein [Planctomycetota bacterium]
MKALLAALVGVYTRWRYVEDTEGDKRSDAAPAARETPKDEVTRIRAAIARERRNLESYLRFQCSALAGPCQDSIHAMEGRLRALEMMGRRAV